MLDPVKKVHELVPSDLYGADPLGNADAHQVIAEGILDKILERVKDLGGLPLKAFLIHPGPDVVENMAGAYLHTVVLFGYAHLDKKLADDPDHNVLVLILKVVLEILDADELIFKCARDRIKRPNGSATDGRAYAAIVNLDQVRLLAYYLRPVSFRRLVTFSDITIAVNLRFHEQVNR